MQSTTPDSYTKLLVQQTKRRLGRKIQGKPRVERTICDCGKPVSVNVMERHLTTEIHRRLFKLKMETNSFKEMKE